MIRFAKFVSYLFHPANFILLAPFLFLYRQPDITEVYVVKWISFTFGFLLCGLISFAYGRWRGWFSDNDLTKREERYKFYSFCLTLAFIFFLITFLLKGAYSPLSIIAFGIIFGIGIFDVVNHYTKASIHVGVATAFTISVGLLYGKEAFLLTAWTPILTTWSRLILKRHTPKEALIGGLLGVIITLITFFLGVKLI